MLSLLFKAITPEHISLGRALITGAAREGNPLSGRCSGIRYRGRDCRNVTIHPPDNEFPGSRTKSRERETSVWQQHPEPRQEFRRSCVCQGGKVAFPILFILSVQKPLRAELLLLSYTQCLCQPVPIPQGCTPVLGTCPPKQDTTHSLSQLSGWAEWNYLSLMLSWPSSFRSPSSGRPWPETGWEYSMSHPCPHVLPLVMALGGASRTPEEPLAPHTTSHLLAKPAHGLPGASFPNRSPETKLGSSHPVMNPG